MSFSFDLSGGTKTEKFLDRLINKDAYRKLDKYGETGVRALSEATPRDSGETANAWAYEIIKEKDSYTIEWTNSNLAENVPVAVLIQYGHGTGTGGYVQGVDYINPALKPIFETIADEIWKEVTRG